MFRKCHCNFYCTDQYLCIDGMNGGHEITSYPQVTGKNWFRDVLHPVEMEHNCGKQFAAQLKLECENVK